MLNHQPSLRVEPYFFGSNGRLSKQCGHRTALSRNYWNRAARNRFAGKLQTSQNIFFFQFRMVFQNFIDAHFGTEHIQNYLDRPPHIPDAGLAVTNIRIDGDAV